MQSEFLQDKSDSLQLDEATDQVLSFILANEEFAVDILRVQEIKGWENATAIPNSPDYVVGVMNLRGTVVPVLDLRMRFGLPLQEYGPTTVVIVLKVMHRQRERIIGFVVDAVSEVYNVSPENIRPKPSFSSAIDAEFIKGLATVADNMIILLDIDFLISRSFTPSNAGLE